MLTQLSAYEYVIGDPRLDLEVGSAIQAYVEPRYSSPGHNRTTREYERLRACQLYGRRVLEQRRAKQAGKVQPTASQRSRGATHEDFKALTELVDAAIAAFCDRLVRGATAAQRTLKLPDPAPSEQLLAANAAALDDFHQAQWAKDADNDPVEDDEDRQAPALADVLGPL